MDFIGHLNENITGEAPRNILSFLGGKRLPTRKADLAQQLNRIWQEEPRRVREALSGPERRNRGRTP